MSRRHRSVLPQKADMNLTAMSDLTFLLLITFIITFPMIEQGIPVKLPKGKSRQMDAQKKTSSVTVDDEGRLFIPVDADERDFTSEQFYQIDKVADVAKMDESLVLHLNLVARSGHSDKVLENNERRNKILQRHLIDLGVPEKQIVITTAEPDKAVKKEGYVVTTSY